MQIVSGRGRNHANQTYGCPMNFYRGDSVCSNCVRVRRDVLERELLAGLHEKVLREDIVSYVMDRFEAELVRELDGIGGEMERVKRRKAELDAETARLAAGLALGAHSPSIMGEIVKREREIADISNRLLSSSADSERMRVKALREKAIGRMGDLRGYLNTDTLKARAYLAEHVEKIAMAPTGKAYIATGNWNLLGERRWDGAEGQS